MTANLLRHDSDIGKCIWR